MEHQSAHNQPRFGQPPRSILNSPQMRHPIEMGMMNIPPPGYPPQSTGTENGNGYENT